MPTTIIDGLRITNTILTDTRHQASNFPVVP